MIRTIITKRAINTPVAKFQNPDVSIVYSKENEDLENVVKLKTEINNNYFIEKN